MKEEHGHAFSSADKALVVSALEPDQLTGERRRQLPRRHMERGELVILWALRIYLLFMMAVVFYQIWSGTHQV